MKEPSVIFTDAEVRAVLDRGKSQFRRVIKPQPHPDIEDWIFLSSRWKPVWGGDTVVVGKQNACLRCPYGQVGDRLWVKECWCEKAWSPGDFHKAGFLDRPYTDSGIDYCGETLKAVYRADGDHKYFRPWKSSTQMPRWASRITLVVTAVRIEQVQKISKADVLAEGVDLSRELFPGINTSDKALRLFREFWNSRNKPEYRWEANPWVFVTDFEVGE